MKNGESGFLYAVRDSDGNLDLVEFQNGGESASWFEPKSEGKLFTRLRKAIAYVMARENLPETETEIVPAQMPEWRED